MPLLLAKAFDGGCHRLVRDAGTFVAALNSITQPTQT